MNQLDFFVSEPASPLLGLRVKLDRPSDRDRPCCCNICTIGLPKGPHAGELFCADCGRHRSWLSKLTADWIVSVITRFGAPTTPIVLRKSHTYEAEAPLTRLPSSNQPQHAQQQELFQCAL